MVNISIRYAGDLHCAAVHGPSQAELATDAPVDNNGKGEAFSPTDLVATALGTCMATVMAIAAQRHDVELNGTWIQITKEMSKDTPRRIVRLASEMHVPLPEDHPQRMLLEAAALGCPVHHSLHPDIEKPVKFVWNG
ncbi:MAG: OsmC family protein [Chthoniobacterales bacterium]|nr:OsmC family protein [Chthoniobacterales bacterium]